MKNPKVMDLSLSVLIVDPDVQRRIDLRRVARMAADFQPQALGTITVSRRGDGSYHIIDGQHRKEAAKEARGDSFKISSRVFEDLTIQEEAELFRLLNATVKPKAFDGFRVRIIEGESVAVHVTDTLKRHGFELGRGARDGMFEAVAAAERIYRLDPNALDRALGTITHAWGRVHSAVDTRIVDGLGSVWFRYGDAIDGEALAQKLARYPSGPDGLVGNARGMAKMGNVQVHAAMAELIVGIYNSGRRTRALPAWRS